MTDAPGILLDVGGVFHLPDHELALGAAHAAGIEIDRDRIDRAHYAGSAAVVIDDVINTTTPWHRHHEAYFAAHATTLGIPTARRDVFIAALRDAYASAPPWGRIAPGIDEALRSLRTTDAVVGIVCNADGTTRARLDAQGLLDIVEFACLVDSHEVGCSKPDPAIFQLALDQINVAAQDCIYVADMPGIDVPGAQACGIRPLILDPWGDHPHDRTYETVNSVQAGAELAMQR